MAGTKYTINFTDERLDPAIVPPNLPQPLIPGKIPFQINPGEFDGPEMEGTNPAKCHTSIHLFGQGFLRYGEKANENFLRLLENFASSDAPLKPTIGQLWFDTSSNILKVFDKTQTWSNAGGVLPPQTFLIISADTGSSRFFLDGDVTSSFSIGDQFVVTGGPNPGTYTVGGISFNTMTEITVTTPIAVSLGGGNISASPQPAQPAPGQLWFNIIDGTLYVWTGSDWVNLFIGTVSGDLDMMEANRILNLPNPADGRHATNKDYVDTSLSTLSASLSSTIQNSNTSLQSQIDGKVSKLGDTVTGTLNVQGNGSYVIMKDSGGIERIRMGGSGLISVEPDIKIDAAGLITTGGNAYLHFDGDNDGTSTFTIARGSNAHAGSETNLFQILNNGTVRALTNASTYASQTTDDRDITNKKYVDTAISTSLTGKADNVSTQTMWVPANAMIPTSTNGAGFGTTETSINKIMLKTLDFDSLVVEHAQFSVRMPKGWNPSPMSVEFTWSAPATGTVVWGIKAVAHSDGDTIDVAFGSSVFGTDANSSISNVYTIAATSSVSISNNPIVSDLITFDVYRNVTNPSDTIATDVRLHGVTIKYLTSTLNDA